MTRLIALVLLLLFCIACKTGYQVVETPTDYTTVVKKGRTTGVIFTKDADCFLCFQDKNRFTPSLADLEEAERILKDNIKSANELGINQVDNCPVIHKNLRYYRRQYFSYVDDDGDRIIYATFNWDRYTLLDRLRGIYRNEQNKWKQEREMVLDGCSYHWEIKINLDRCELFDFDVNGVA